MHKLWVRYRVSCCRRWRGPRHPCQDVLEFLLLIFTLQARPCLAGRRCRRAGRTRSRRRSPRWRCCQRLACASRHAPRMLISSSERRSGGLRVLLLVVVVCACAHARGVKGWGGRLAVCCALCGCNVPDAGRADDPSTACPCQAHPSLQAPTALARPACFPRCQPLYAALSQSRLLPARLPVPCEPAPRRCPSLPTGGGKRRTRRTCCSASTRCVCVGGGKVLSVIVPLCWCHLAAPLVVQRMPAFSCVGCAHQSARQEGRLQTCNPPTRASHFRPRLALHAPTGHPGHAQQGLHRRSGRRRRRAQGIRAGGLQECHRHAAQQQPDSAGGAGSYQAAAGCLGGRGEGGRGLQSWAPAAAAAEVSVRNCARNSAGSRYLPGVGGRHAIRCPAAHPPAHPRWLPAWPGGPPRRVRAGAHLRPAGALPHPHHQERVQQRGEQGRAAGDAWGCMEQGSCPFGWSPGWLWT